MILSSAADPGEPYNAFRIEPYQVVNGEPRQESNRGGDKMRYNLVIVHHLNLPRKYATTSPANTIR